MSDSIKSLMEKLTREEKVSLVAGHDMWTTVAIPRLGIPALKVTDGPNGARGGSFWRRRWWRSQYSLVVPLVET